MGATDVCRDTVPESDQVLSALADARRRQILSTVCGTASPMAISVLADGLVATAAPSVGSGVDRPSARATLRHVHLPALSSVGLVRWDESRGTVAAGRLPMLADDDALAALDTGEAHDEVIDCLADGRRRAILATLRDGDGSLDRAELVGAIREYEGSTDLSADAIERRQVSLRHAHLPKLADAGLLRVESERVALTGDDRLETAWALVAALEC